MVNRRKGLLRGSLEAYLREQVKGYAIDKIKEARKKKQQQKKRK